MAESVGQRNQILGGRFVRLPYIATGGHSLEGLQALL